MLEPPFPIPARILARIPADVDAAMTQSSNRILDEIARLATDAAGAAQGVRREVETVVRGQIERLIKEMDVATREEVEVLRDMVVAAREENERLEARLKVLEAAHVGSAAKTKPA
jgi:BMFP domain-containing protein YqiC